MPTTYHYHFHWLPSRQLLDKKPLPCLNDHCTGGEIITLDRHGHERGELCRECEGEGRDPDPRCGNCDAALDTWQGPVGALVEAHYRRAENLGGREVRWRYLLCGPCAWKETMAENGEGTIVTAEPSEAP